MMNLDFALSKSKHGVVTKSLSSSNVVNTEKAKVMVVKNHMTGNLLVYENLHLVGNSSMKDIVSKYGNSGWEVGK